MAVDPNEVGGFVLNCTNIDYLISLGLTIDERVRFLRGSTVHSHTMSPKEEMYKGEARAKMAHTRPHPTQAQNQAGLDRIAHDLKQRSEALKAQKELKLEGLVEDIQTVSCTPREMDFTPNKPIVGAVPEGGQVIVQNPSTSRPNVIHSLYIHPDTGLGCSCEAFKFRKKQEQPCKHIIQYQKEMRPESLPVSPPDQGEDVLGLSSSEPETPHG